ncbi:molybdenum cofactor biosynthesis protein B [Corynebacterium sp.]|uniref:MogA/MoaB family molybdenum cofactor biosynthesis protein n=1 Tax=Corynebacterium sp. TaxID=1720 RepID=UPI0026DB9BF4|nr:MogA/MoaB family molybdenum cofactor biosynthesis protein [Corynebacterium sp.]MDO5032558.1 MogA/MoaB family molybdenum cofactor biosynthesis protein [Corynebacterium sp.]
MTAAQTPSLNQNQAPHAKTAIVVVSSTRAAAGEYEDRSGPILVDFLRAQGFNTAAARVVPDAKIAEAVAAAFAERPAVILTSGGTGITADDRTVEAVSVHIEREMPGLAHAFYSQSAGLPTAALSRTIAGVTGTTFAMALPGSTGAAKDAVAVLEPVLGHIMNLLEGNNEH